MRTQPPRLVHAVQRSVQLSVTSDVTQITVNGAFDWAIDISAPHTMWPPFERRRPLVARGTPVSAGPGRVGQPPAGSVPGATVLLPRGRHGRRGLARSRRPRPRTPRRILAGRPPRARSVGTDRDATVIAAIHPARVGAAGNGAAVRSREGMSAAAAGHQFQLRIAHAFLVVVRWRGSPVPVPHSRAPSELHGEPPVVPVAHRRSVVPRVIARVNERLLFTMRAGRIWIRPARRDQRFPLRAAGGGGSAPPRPAGAGCDGSARPASGVTVIIRRPRSASTFRLPLGLTGR
jgi:hypothetical protein